MYKHVLVHFIITPSYYHSMFKEKPVIAVTTYQYQSSKDNASKNQCQSSANAHAYTQDG